MTVLLVEFLHDECYEDECRVYHGVEFGVKPKGRENQLTVFDTIKLAVDNHVSKFHLGQLGDKVSAYFLWDGEANSASNLLEMDDNTACAQIALARDRGHLDVLQVRFSTRDASWYKRCRTNTDEELF